MESSDWVLGAFMVLMIVVTVIGNILVIVVICKNKKLRNRENVFVVSLAVSDLLVGSLVVPFAVPTDLTDRWLMGQILCYVWVTVDITCTTSSIFSICAVSFVRYIKIRRPYRYQMIVSKQMVAILLALIWVVPTTATISLYHLGDTSQTSCGLQCDLRHSPDKLAVYSILSYFLPCLAMIVIYIRLYLCCQRHLNQISVSLPYQRAWNNYKTVITIGVVMGTFLICWIPVQLSLLIHVISRTDVNHEVVSRKLYKFFTWLGYSNSMLDPIVYSLMNKDFRKCFRDSLIPSIR